MNWNKWQENELHIHHQYNAKYQKYFTCRKDDAEKNVEKEYGQNIIKSCHSDYNRVDAIVLAKFFAAQPNHNIDDNVWWHRCYN